MVNYSAVTPLPTGPILYKQLIRTKTRMVSGNTRARTRAHKHRGGHVNTVSLLLNLKPEAFFLTLSLAHLNILEAEAVFTLKQGRTFRTRGGKKQL